MGKVSQDGSEHVYFFPSDPPDLGKSFSSSFQYNFKNRSVFENWRDRFRNETCSKGRAIDRSPDRTEWGQPAAPECGPWILQPWTREQISQHLILLSTNSDSVN